MKSMFSRETNPIGFGEKEGERVYFKERTLAIMEADKSKLWTCSFGKLRESIYSSSPRATRLEKRKETTL